MVRDIKIILDITNYSPGSLVEGQVMVSVDRPRRYHSMVINLQGGAEVHWTKTRQFIDRERTVHYRNSDTYVNREVVLWKAEYSPTGSLPVGEHYLPFILELPQNIPHSFEGTYGQVRYELEASILQSIQTNFVLRSKHAIIVENNTPMDILRLCREPRTVAKTKRLKILIFGAGSISTTVSVPRTGFSPGDTIPININVSNQSSRRICVDSVLRRRSTLTASGGEQKVISRQIAKTVLPFVMPWDVISCEMFLDVPIDIQASMRNCSCIRVKYVLAIKVHIPWSFYMQELKIPVVIANDVSVGPAVLYRLQPQPPARND